MGVGEGSGSKVDPSCFMRWEILFLGQGLGKGRVSTMDDKVQNVKDWPTPSSVCELKSFLGLSSYCRRFVKGFSCIAAPLFQLLQKVRTAWAEECQASFTSPQRALTEALVLVPPQLALPFVLDTDANSISSGAVLSQVMGGRECWDITAGYSTVLNIATVVVTGYS